MSSSTSSVGTDGMALSPSLSCLCYCLILPIFVRGYTNLLLDFDFISGIPTQTSAGSRMIEHFVLESAHRGAYVAGTVSSRQRTKNIIVAIDKALSSFNQASPRSE